MSDSSFQLEIASVRRRIENLEERIGTLTDRECHIRKRSELLLKEIEELEGILRSIWRLRSWAFDEYSLLIFERAKRCEGRLVQYKSRLAALEKLDRDEFERAVLMDIKEITKPVWLPDVG